MCLVSPLGLVHVRAAGGALGQFVGSGQVEVVHGLGEDEGRVDLVGGCWVMSSCWVLQSRRMTIQGVALWRWLASPHDCHQPSLASGVAAVRGAWPTAT